MSNENNRHQEPHPKGSLNPAQRAPGNMSGQQVDDTELEREAGDPDGPESSQPGNRSS